MRHFILCRANEGTAAEATALLLLANVWKIHRLPNAVVSDRHPQFIAEV